MPLLAEPLLNGDLAQTHCLPETFNKTETYELDRSRRFQNDDRGNLIRGIDRNDRVIDYV